MDAILPLFPLQLVAFIGETVNLHIFEPRYRQLIKESAETGNTFGISPFIEGHVMQIGTEMELVEIVKTYPGGEMDVTTRGVGIFKMVEFFNPGPQKLYSGSTIEKVDFNTKGDLLTAQEILLKIRQLFTVLNINKSLPTDPHDLVTYNIAHHVGLSLEQEYDFLCMFDEVERQQFILTHLNQFLPAVEESHWLKDRGKMNGHFKNIIPPTF